MVDLSKMLGRIVGRKDWLESVGVEELEKERIKIDNQIQLLSKEIQKLEKTKKELFREGIGKSEVEKLLLAEKIKDVDAEAKMKLNEYNTLMKQRRALSNLIRLKRWEEKLKETGIWQRIKSVSPDRLIEILSRVELSDDMFVRNIDKINEILGERFVTVKMDRDTEEIMKLWQRVEKAELSPEAVEEKLAVRLEAKEAEEREKEAE